jgi:hypothetical protein
VCVRRSVKLQYACLYVCGSVMWVALAPSEVGRVLSWWLKWARSVEAMGLVRESEGMWWNMVPASRWTRTRDLSVCGEVLSDMMDYVG